MKKLKNTTKRKKKRTKTMIDFDQNESNSIRSVAIQKHLEVDLTTRFIKGKMLMFSNFFLKSFANDFIKTFCFTTEEIYNRNSNIKCHMYLNLADTDSIHFLNFLFPK